jgi:hypothetical protein
MFNGLRSIERTLPVRTYTAADKEKEFYKKIWDYEHQGECLHLYIKLVK